MSKLVQVNRSEQPGRNSNQQRNDRHNQSPNQDRDPAESTRRSDLIRADRDLWFPVQAEQEFSQRDLV